MDGVDSVKKVAEERLQQTSQTMLLEDQLPPLRDRKLMRDSLVETLVHEMPRELWRGPA